MRSDIAVLLALVACGPISNEDLEETGAEGDADTDSDTDSDTDTDTVAYTVCADGGAPFTEIQDALDAAAPGDTLHVCPGVYGPVRVTTGVDATIVGAGFDTTAIFGGTGTALTVEGGTLRIQGLSVRGTGVDDAGGAVDMSGGTLEVSDARVDACGGAVAVAQSGGASVWEHVQFEDNTLSATLYAATGAATVDLVGSVFTHNDASALFYAGDTTVVRIRNVTWWANTYRSGIVAGFDGWDGGDHTVTNNVFYDNVDPGMNDAHSAVLLAVQLVDFRNNIVFGNPTSDELSDVSVQLDYSLFYGNDAIDTSVTGSGNLYADPHFTDPDAGDFTLQAGYSPAIDAGDPASTYNDPDGSRNDMGVHGGPYAN